MGAPLQELCAHPEDPDRVIFSEYHAVGAVSGAFMIRKGHYKLIHYEGFAPELFDLVADPEETRNLADDSAMASVRDDLYSELKAICQPAEVDMRAHADQAALVEGYGGFEVAKTMGARAATPPPEIT